MATILSPEAQREIGALIERMVEARDRGDYRTIEIVAGPVPARQDQHAGPEHRRARHGALRGADH